MECWSARVLKTPQPTKDRPLNLRRRFPTGFQTTWITANPVGALNLAAAAPERRSCLRFASTRLFGAPRRWVGRNFIAAREGFRPLRFSNRNSPHNRADEGVRAPWKERTNLSVAP